MPDWITNALQASVFGNSLQNWAIAAGWLLLVAAAVSAAKPVLISRLDALSRRTSTHWDDAVVDALRGTRTLLIVAVALYPVVKGLALQPVAVRWLVGLSAVGLFLQAGLWVSRFVDHMIRTSRDHAMEADPETATGLAVMSYLARLIIWSLVLLLLLDNLGFNVTTLLAGLGVGGIAVGLALQNILGDLFSSLSIVLDKPFQIGHFVVVDGFSGTVENIGLKTTRIRSLSGEMLVFSNTDLTKARLRNYKSMQERRIAFSLGVNYATPVETMAELPEVIRQIILQRPGARFDRAHFTTFGESSLVIEVVYWMTTPDYAAYMDTQQAINLELMRQFARLGVGFAFPTRTVELRMASAEMPAVAAAASRGG